MDATKEHPDAEGLDWGKTERLGVCHSCPAGKAVKLHVPNSSAGNLKAQKGERIHADCSGKLTTRSPGGANYVHYLVENTTRLNNVSGIMRAPGVTEVIERWIDASTVGVNAGGQVRQLLTDQDPKSYGSDHHQERMRRRKIQSLPSPGYRAEYNGIAERGLG